MKYLPALWAGLTVLISALGGCSVRTNDPPPPGPTLRTLYNLKPIRQLAPQRTALLLVDFQEEFFHGKLPLPEAPRAAARARHLLDWARRTGVAVIHVRNLTPPGSAVFAPDSPTSAFAPHLHPTESEQVVTKTAGGAFTHTDLDARLRAQGIQTVVVAGLMTHLAVTLSAQDAALLGYQVIVAADATATRALPGVLGSPGVEASTLAQVALTALADRFAEILTVEQVETLARPDENARLSPGRSPE